MPFALRRFMALPQESRGPGARRLLAASLATVLAAACSPEGGSSILDDPRDGRPNGPGTPTHDGDDPGDDGNQEGDDQKEPDGNGEQLQPGELREDCNGPTLDPGKWKIAFKNWGGQVQGAESYNGGVHPDNVKVRDGLCILEAHGNRYEGLPMGINKDGSVRPDGKRVGAAMATSAYFASGSYRVRMKIAPVLGVSSTMWTFHYQEVSPGSPRYEGTGPYHVVNHEIDIELPGRPGPAHRDIGFSRALANTWVGETDDRYTVNYTDLGQSVADGQFHTFRFDWHTGGADGSGRKVDFYLDDRLISTNTTHVPTLAGRLWIAAWFPAGWAGVPDFDVSTVEIDWVRIIPFKNAGDQQEPETYADDGWAP